MIYSICDFYVEYTPRYPRLTARSEKYLVKNQDITPDFSFEITEEEIDAHMQKYPVDRDLSEYVLAGMKFYEEIISRGAFIIHSAALGVDGNGFVFTGPCGAGKSTHASLWRKYFGSKVVSINDDKPVVKIENDTAFICGTPFSGKHDINANVKVPLCGIAILHQSPENRIERIMPAKAIPVLLEQTLRPKDMKKMSELFSLLDETLMRVPVYDFYCNISFEAVETSFRTMKGDVY